MGGACKICGSQRSVPWLERDAWRYRACSNCSAVWLDPLPAEDWAEEFYDQGYFTGGGRGGYQDYLADEEQHRINGKARVALGRRFGANPRGTWLDVGCAAGFTLDEARKEGFTALGVEPSPWARKVASERFGLSVSKTFAEPRRALGGRIDIASFFQVLEHIRDPVAALAEAHACLRPGGLLLIETWDRGSTIARLFGRHWQQITPPSVLWLLNRNSLTHALERAGFRARAILGTSKRVSLVCALGILADKEPRLLGPALRALGRSAPRRFAITYSLGDLISVAAIAEGSAGHGTSSIAEPA